MTCTLDQSTVAEDLDHILEHTEQLWQDLRGQRLFLTGGTGFVGTWLLESFAWANARLNINASVCVLTRNSLAFRQRHPNLTTDAALQFTEGNVTSFEFPDGEFSCVIHAATENDSTAAPLAPLTHFEANVGGTRRVLEFARHCGAERVLFTSSGAVYGPQPPELKLLPETYCGAPSPLSPATAYGQSKRVSEFLCAAMAQERGCCVTIARIFALVGPLLKLNANFAIGNFIRDALRHTPIEIQGDGTPYRSYLYASDMTIWLWTILMRGQSGQAYNVGSDQAICISELAQRVAGIVAPGTPITIGAKADPKRLPSRYVPSIDLARKSLGLDVWVDLNEGIQRTAQWYRDRPL